MLTISSENTIPIAAGHDTVRTRFDTSSDMVQVSVGRDSLQFDVGRLADTVWKDWSTAPTNVPAERLRLTTLTPTRRAMLALQTVNGRRTANAVNVEHWQGKLLLGKP
jgi:hypothetical protein